MSLYLLAVLPPESIDLQVRVWKEYMREKYDCRVALKSPAHITLIPPFQLSGDQASLLLQLLDVFALKFTSFDLKLKNFAAFPPGVIYIDVIRNEKLGLLKDSLEELLITEGFPIKKEERAFHPHVTIANRDLKKHDFAEAWAYFKQLAYSNVFSVTAITLLKHNGQVWNREAHARLHGN